MVNYEEKQSYVEQFYNAIEERKSEQLKDLDLAKYMADNDLALIKQGVEKIQANVIVSIPEGIPVPKATLYVTASGSGNEITVVNLSLSSKIKAEKKFKYAKSFIDDGITDNILAFFAEAYEQLIVDYMAEVNLEEVNALLAKAAEMANLSYSIKMTSVIGGTKVKLAEISDDAVVFVADSEKVFQLDDILALANPEENEFIEAEDVEKAIQQVADDLEACQTPEQLVQNYGGILVGTIANINKNCNPATIIKGVCNKTVERLAKSTGKNPIGYYLKDNVYSLVAKKDDGSYEMVLSPFNLETFHKEKVDVLQAVANL